MNIFIIVFSQPYILLIACYWDEKSQYWGVQSGVLRLERLEWLERLTGKTVIPQWLEFDTYHIFGSGPFFSGSSQKLLSNWTLDIHCMYISLFVECKMKLARFFNGKIRNFISFATVITWGHLQPIKQYLGGANYGVINHNVSSCLT